MIELVAAFFSLIAQLAIAWGLGHGIARALGATIALRAAAGGSLGECLLGFCAATAVLELSICIAPARFPIAASVLHALGGGLALLFMLQRVSARARTRAQRIAERAPMAIVARSTTLLSLAIAGALACALGGAGLAGVDALEVYQLKARALHEGTLESLSPRTLGSSHPLFVSIAVAWHAQLAGAISSEAQRWFSLFAWITAAAIFSAAAARELPPRRAAIASVAFAVAPPLLAIAARAEADLPLIACVLAAAACWCLRDACARALAVLFASGAAAAKNEGLAWIAIAGCGYLLGAGASSRRERVAARCAAAFAAAGGLLLLRCPAMIMRSRWGAFVEHLDGAPLDVLADPLYLLLRGEAILSALGRAGFSAESGYAAALWMLALALWWAGRAPLAGGPIFLGGAWLACVFAGMLVGPYDASWQAGVAAARVWIQASPWLVLALAMAGVSSREAGAAMPASTSRNGVAGEKTRRSRHGPDDSSCHAHVGHGEFDPSGRLSSGRGSGTRTCMRVGAIPQKTRRLRSGLAFAIALVAAIGWLPGCGEEEPRAPAVGPYDEAVFVPAIPAEIEVAAVQAVSRAIALPPAEVLSALALRSGLDEVRWNVLLASIEVDREHPYTSKADRDPSGRHRLAWRVRGRPQDERERVAIDDLRAAVELEVWSRALDHLVPFDPALEIRASALDGPRGTAAPRRIGERAGLALERLKSRGVPCDRWERVRAWSALSR